MAAHWQFTLLLVIFATLALVYSLVVPLGEAADEAEHFALIRFIAETGRPPLNPTEQQNISAKGDASPLYHGLVALLTQHVDVSALPDLPDPRHLVVRAIPGDRLPFKGLYHTENEAFPFKGIVLAWHLARLVSIPLGLATVTAVYLTVLAIYPHRPYFALAAAAFAAFIPRFVIGSAIVSDDNLVLPLIAFALYVLVRIILGDERDRSFVILGALMGAAAVAKYHSLLLLPEAALVLVILAWRRWDRPARLRRWGLTLLAFGLASGWWFVFLFLQFNQVAELGWLRGLLRPLGDPVISEGVGRPDPNLGYETSLGWWEWAGLLFRTFWFRLGRGHVITAPAVNAGLVVVVLAAVLGLALKSREQLQGGWLRPGRRQLIFGLFSLHLLLYLLLIVARFMLLPTRETAQGRHLYPALIPIAFFLVLGLSQLWFLLRRRPAGRLLAAGVAGVSLLFSILALPLFIIPIYYPYLPIRLASLAEAPPGRRLEANLAEGLNLEGYALPANETRAGQALPVTLYWYAGSGQERDYLVRLCLHDTAGRPAACHLGHPANGRYPLRAWEAGYLIRDEIFLPLPACLPAGSYDLLLSVLPLRPDQAVAVIDDQFAAPAPLTLGQVTLAAGAETTPAGFDLWAAGRRYRQGLVELRQLRQALTLVTYLPEGSPAAEVSLRPEPDSFPAWTPAASGPAYACPGGPVATVYHFLVDPAVAPAAYALQTGDQIRDGLTVTVQTRPRLFTPPADPGVRLEASFGSQVELIGYRFDPAPRLPGDTLDIEVHWRALRWMQRRYVGSIHLLDQFVTMWGQIDHVLGDDFEYPNVLWAPGEIVRQTFHLPLGDRTPPGLYTLEFGVYDHSAGTFDFLPVTAPGQETVETKQLRLGQLQVLDPAHADPPAYPLQAALNEQVQLLGYDLKLERAAGQQALHLALHWQALRPLATDYTVFTQLIGPDGQLWGQQDNQPQAGRYPTTAWQPGEKVVDRYDLLLAAGAPPGSYRLLAGMYDLPTGQRLPAVDGQGNPLPDNAVLLATIPIEPD